MHPAGFVIGTAGHIDHGKSTLVKALTGIDPDRLEEERRRGMTIDLGFAHLDLPSGRRVGIVDVPGHERLVRNMLAGAGGLDAVLLVVAADEGVMPQTREHLDILRFLRVPRGIVVLTKVDLVPDAEWLAAVEAEVAELVRGTLLETAPCLHVSARTGEGLDRLVMALDRLLDEVPQRPVDGPVRLPVDRVFTMPGFGTVVTGTLWSGRVRPGDVLEVLPGGERVRVRQVQRHGAPVEVAVAGSRTALNLSGIERERLERGVVLATPGTFTPATLLDARLRLLPGVPPLRHLAQIRVYLGTAEVLARVALLDRDQLRPGEEAPVQLRLEGPLVAARGDAFVVRRSSPPLTLGGGEVVTVNPPKRRRGPAAAAEVAALAQADLGEVMRGAVAASGLAGVTVEDLLPQLGEARERVAEEAARLAGLGSLLQVRERYFDAALVAAAEERLVALVAATHAAAPWRLGLPREEARARAFAGADDRLFGAVLERLVAAGRLALTRGFLHEPQHVPRYTPEEAALRRAVLERFRAGRYAPPTLEEVRSTLGGPADLVDRMAQSLIEAGELVEVAPGVIVPSDVLADVRRQVVEHIAAAGAITVAELRDRLGTSRKYALALLEYLDATRVTRRTGDRRVLAGHQARTAGAGERRG
jgi:selenocysteine-specific elongation factor